MTLIPRKSARITRRAVVGAGVAAAGLPAFAASAAAPSLKFSITEHLGRDWRTERVRFDVGDAVAALRAGFGAVDAAGRPVPAELVEGDAVELLVDLAPFTRGEWALQPGAPPAPTDLRVETTDALIVLGNDQGRVAIRRRLAAGEGPLAGIDLGDGTWIGGSHLDRADPVAAYEAAVTRRGPVAATVVCRTRFASGISWELQLTLQAGDPAVLIAETWSQWRHPAWSLDFGAAFDPTQLYFRGGSGDTLGRVLQQPIGGAPGEPIFTLEPWLYWWIAERRGTWFAALPAKGDWALTLAALRGDLWVSQAEGAVGRRVQPLQAVRTASGFELKLPAEGARRMWLLAMQPRAAADPSFVGKSATPPPQQLVIRHGDFPLNRVKDLALDWPAPTEPYAPLILTHDDRAELNGRAPPPGAAEQAAAFRPTGAEINDARLNNLFGCYLATGDADLGRRLAAAALPQMQAAVDQFLTQDWVFTLGFAPHWRRQLINAAHFADHALAGGYLSEADQTRLRAQAAFLAATVSRPDFWSPVRGFAANPGMTTTALAYAAYLAALVIDHPAAPAQLATALTELIHELETWSDDNGGWLEAPHYAMNAIDLMVGAALCARSRGQPELIDHPRLKRVAEWFAQITTPPDVRLAGARHLPPIGNTFLLEATGEFGLFAWLWRKSDPELSARLKWMHRASGAPVAPFPGGAYPALAPYRSAFQGAALRERTPAYGSALFPKTGAVLRAHFGTERETALLVIAGPNHEHYDYDSGSVTIWGKGRRIADDFGYTGRAPMSDHSMVDSPGTGEPMQIEAFRTGAAADYFAGVSGAWRRQILFAKSPDPLGPNYYVIRDRLDGGAAGTWRIYLAGDVRLEGSGAVALGDEDVATDIALLADRPLAPHLARLSRTTSSGGAQSVTTTTQTALVAELRAGAALIAVVWPRLKTERPPRITLSRDGRSLRIVSAHGADIVEVSDAGLARRTS